MVPTTGVSVFAVVIAYLLGSIPFGLILSRAISGVDPRTIGSKNIGATNVARASGRWVGALTLVLDAFKGAAPIWVAHAIALPDWAIAACASAAVIGHVAPPWLRFRGGKGVATGFGVTIAMCPEVALLAVCIFGAAFVASRRVSAASLAAAISVFLASLLFSMPASERWSLVLICIVIVLRHRANIQRLLNRSEPRF